MLPTEPLRLQTVLLPHGPTSASIQFFSQPGRATGDAWVLNVSAELARLDDQNGAPSARLERRSLAGSEPMDRRACYADFEKRGENYGSQFQGIHTLWRLNGQALAEVIAPEALKDELSQYRFHPAFLDACMHALVMATPARGETGFMPTRIERIVVYGPGASHAWSLSRTRTQSTMRPNMTERRRRERKDADIELFDSSGRMLMVLLGVRLQYLDESAKRAAPNDGSRWCYEMRWLPAGEVPAAPIRSDTAIQPGGGGTLAHRGGSVRSWQGTVVRYVEAAGYASRVIEPEDDVGIAIRNAAADNQRLHGIVYLRGLDAPDPSATTIDAVTEGQHRQRCDDRRHRQVAQRADLIRYATLVDCDPRRAAGLADGHTGVAVLRSAAGRTRTNDRTRAAIDVGGP